MQPTPADNLDPGARVIVNTNFGTTNIVPMEESLPQIKSTLKACQDILKEHCGPQSGYAMLVNNLSAGTNFEPNVFTRDGIRILSAIEFLSPLERYIKDMLTYVGSRVDNTAKDGTTTSMLFSALFLDNILDELKKLQQCDLSFFQMNRVIDTVFSQALEHLKTYTFDVQKLANVANEEDVTETDKVRAAGPIALMQALSSSGGNLELALSMKEIFEKSPSVSWDFITSHHSVKETGKAFSVEVCPYDSRIQCISTLQGQMNSALNTEFEAEDAEVLVITSAIDDMSIKTDAILEYLRNADTDKPIVVVSSLIGGTITNEVFKLNLLRNKKISMWQYSSTIQRAGMTYPYELLILAAVAGATPFDFDEEADVVTDKHVFKAKKLHWHDSYLEFFDIFDGDTNGLHPFYVDPDNATEFYKQTRIQLENQIKLYREGHKIDGKMFGLFMEMLNKLACVHRPTLRLGGPAHEQVANADVVQDVQGAIMSSLKHGFLINGPVSIKRALCDVHEEITAEESSLTFTASEREFARIIIEKMIESISVIITTVHGKDNLTNISADIDTYVNSLDGKERSFKTFLEQSKSYDETDPASVHLLENCYPVLQPVTITIELLKRIRELLMKFVNTNKIVVYGGVMVKEPVQEK